MPPKKDNKLSKAKLMARKRASMTEEEKALKRQADKERKAEKRNNMSEQEKEEQRKADSRRKAEKRAAAKTQTYTVTKRTRTWPQFERENNRKYKVRIRENRSEAEHEYEKVYNLICMRKLRAERTDEDHQHDKSAAKTGMKLVREFGYLKPFQERARGIKQMDEMDIWMNFYQKGSKFKNVLKDKNPDIASKLQDILDIRMQEDEEKRAKIQKQRDDGFWEFDYNMDRWMWTGINSHGPEDPADPNVFDTNPLTEEERMELYLTECREERAKEAEEYRLEKNRKERERYYNKKKDLLEPIEVPEFELSEYEKIREQNIKDREDALRAAGFKW